ncbi:MAG: phosphonoacetaldehyde reductase [Anaerotignum sp.]|nr:phosphonoacetaldehyde reductase [Anaerotignum sp.]
MNHYYNPVRTICGSGAIDELPRLLNDMISPKGKVLLIAWNGVIPMMDVFNQLRKEFVVRTIEFNESNPTVEQLFGLYNRTESFDPDVVIAVGGGSVMDVGKSLCCFYGKNISSPDEMRKIIAEKDYDALHTKWIGVPTTSGTGSEVTCWATIWDPAQNAKRSVDTSENYAYAAVVDPDLTKGMPLKLAVSSALDAVAHAVESYWAKATNTVSRGLALEAIRTIMGSIDKLLTEGGKDARLQMAKGSMLAGLAFSNTRTTGCHSISYPLTMHHNIPHGAAVSMLIGPVLELNAPMVEGLQALLEAFGAKEVGEIRPRIESILSAAGHPIRLQEWGVTEKDLPRLVSQSITKGRADNNPAELTEEVVSHILNSIF